MVLQRGEIEALQKKNKASLTACQIEIQQLKDECAAKMERLDKKERELKVLRESLNEPSTGYISDEGDEDEDYDDVGTAVESIVTIAPENLELLLIQGNDRIGAMTAYAITGEADLKLKAMEKELEAIRREKENTMTDMRRQEESLANAKMIISSLEKANKTMLEDLRSRLHDSNTAIVSLLEKSSKHEQTAVSQKAEIEVLHKSKEKEIALKEKELQRVKEESLANACRLAAREQEMDQLQLLLLKKNPAPLALVEFPPCEVSVDSLSNSHETASNEGGGSGLV